MQSMYVYIYMYIHRERGHVSYKHVNIYHNVVNEKDREPNHKPSPSLPETGGILYSTNYPQIGGLSLHMLPTYTILSAFYRTYSVVISLISGKHQGFSLTRRVFLSRP